MIMLRSDVFEALPAHEHELFGGMKAAGIKRGQKKRQAGGQGATSAEPRRAGQPLSAAQVKLMRRSFARLEKKSAITGLVFYRHLFTLAPSLRRLFHTD